MENPEGEHLSFSILEYNLHGPQMCKEFIK